MKSSVSFFIPLLAFGVVLFDAAAQEFRAGSLVINQPWSRATPGGARVGAGYMTITNTGNEPDRLIGGSLPQAGEFEMHEMRLKEGLMTMRPVPGGIEIKPGQTVKLEPAAIISCSWN